MGKVYETILVLFLCIGPIYWFPGVPSVVLDAVKFFLFATVLALLFIKYWRKNLSLPVSIILAFLIFLVLDLIPTIVHETIFFQTYLGTIIFFLIGYILARNEGREKFIRILMWATFFFSLFPLLVIYDFLVGGLFLNPLYEYKLFLSQTGFHGGRTGWAATSNYFLGFSLFCLLGSVSTTQKMFLYGGILVLFLNILLVDSRGGALVAIFLLLFYFILTVHRSKKKALLISIGALLGSSLFVTFFGEQFLTSRIFISLVAPDELHSGLTTGRTSGFQTGIDLWSSAPLLGIGDIDMRDYGANAQEIHNVWLRVLIERGLFSLLGLLIFSAATWKQVLNGTNVKKGHAILFLCAGFVPTFFEPTAIFGNYFSTAIFWLFLGALASKK